MAGLDQDGSDPRDLLRILRRRSWLLLLCVVLVPSAIYSYSSRLDPVYESAVLIQAQSAGEAAGLGVGQEATPAQNTAAVARLALTTAVANEAAGILDEPLGSVALKATSVDENTSFITMTAQGGSPERAAAIANAFAEALGVTRTRSAELRIDRALADLRVRRAQSSDPAERRVLRDELAQLDTLRKAQGENVQVIEPARIGTKISPHPTRNATLGLIAGALLGLALMLLAERFDRTLRRPEELRIDGVPLLATIPKEAFPGESASPHLADAFQTLRDSLTYFNIDRELKSIAVTSPLKGDGKTTVAVNLALSLASAGRTVILVDADLRSPQIASRMGIAGTIGLSQVLAGAPLADAMCDHGSGLRILPAGPSPPNPSQLIGSARMTAILDVLTQNADIVVVDTSPLLAVSDAFPLLNQVSGVVGLAKLNQTPRPAVRRMLEIIATAGGEAQILGMVATGTGPGDAEGYGYGYGYGAEAKSGGSPGPSRPFFRILSRKK